jgi:glycosyltransferase involved in cell wall biosynthesis
MLAKKIKGFQVIEEVGEIFNDVEHVAMAKREQEIKVIQQADYYLYSTELLDKICNPSNKPYAVAQGTYKNQKTHTNIFKDGKRHLVYAGILRMDKGVDVAIRLGKYLDEEYIIHILGYGTNDDVKRVQKEIKKVNEEGKAKVVYEGLKSGDEYNQFIQSCDLGLCTQSADVAYNSTAFPSKIISYLSNGIPVVAIKIQSIEFSEVRHLLFLYENEKYPEMQIANLITNLDFKKYTKQYIAQEIDKLDKKFKAGLKAIID